MQLHFLLSLNSFILVHGVCLSLVIQQTPLITASLVWVFRHRLFAVHIGPPVDGLSSLLYNLKAVR